MEIERIVAESKASQNKQELGRLMTLVDSLKPKMILEIGVHTGYSLLNWRKRWPDAQIIGIENDVHSLIEDAVKDCLIVVGDSHHMETRDTVSMYLKNKKLDFLFIDGDHTYLSICKDFELYSPLVRHGGIIAFHDASLKGHPLVDTHKWWERNAHKYGHELIVGGDALSSDSLQAFGTGTGVIYV